MGGRSTTILVNGAQSNLISLVAQEGKQLKAITSQSEVIYIKENKSKHKFCYLSFHRAPLHSMKEPHYEFYGHDPP